MIRRIIIAVLVSVATIYARPWQYGISQMDSLSKGLEVYWSMRYDGTNVIDELGRFPGVYHNTPVTSYEYGVVGEGTLFNNSNTAVTGAVSTVFSGDFSISFWVYSDFASTGARDKFNVHVPSYNNLYILVNYNASVPGRADFSLYDGSKNPSCHSPQGVLNANEWNHRVVTREGKTLRNYVHGVLQNTTTDTTTFVPGYDRFSIGGYPQANRWFGGRIDEVRVHSRALTLDEIKALRREGLTIFRNR